MKFRIPLFHLQSVLVFMKKGSRRVMQNRKRQLLATKKYCHYCGCKVSERLINNHERQRPTTATVDHVYSNFDIRRLLSDISHTVLCCYKCNQKRGTIESKNIYGTFDYKLSAFTIDPVNKTIILSPEIFKTA